MFDGLTVNNDHLNLEDELEDGSLIMALSMPFHVSPDKDRALRIVVVLEPKIFTNL